MSGVSVGICVGLGDRLKKRPGGASISQDFLSRDVDLALIGYVSVATGLLIPDVPGAPYALSSCPSNVVSETSWPAS